MTPSERASLRKSLRHCRRQLTPREQDAAASRLYDQVAGKRFFHCARRIAFYLPGDGEIDPGLLMAAALERGQHCYLPVIHPHKKNALVFVRFRSGDVLQTNRWGIYEPRLRSAALIPARALDLVLVPLVGFDAACNRLGMGKGFYDRTFGFRASGVRSRRRSPRLIGVAHECQRVSALKAQDWDIRMDRIVSDWQTYQPQ
ncbi:MAG: 5-formyltetrahydrofolate cyclo-ligase [Gammaproteobacteria bacterium]|nr:5-formyltetrahydrofolate cyclo-ligase [Gammaproteobacteria bacterium]